MVQQEAYGSLPLGGEARKPVARNRNQYLVHPAPPSPTQPAFHFSAGGAERRAGEAGGVAL